MTKTRSHIQDGVDAIVAAALTVAGVTMIMGFAEARAITEALAHVGSLAWAVGLTGASLAALAGVLLRPSGKGFGLELGGWGFLALTVGLYTAMNTWAGGSAAGNAALLALTALLAGKFLRGMGAIRIARRQEDDS